MPHCLGSPTMVAPPQRIGPKALQIRAAALNLPPLDARVGNSALAQLVEQLTVNQRVAGSSPAGGAKLKERPRALFFLLANRPLAALRVRRRSPWTTQPLLTPLRT